MMVYVGAEIWMLTVTISADNFAMGFGGTVLIAYLSSLVNQSFTATQYALMSSLMSILGKFTAGYSGNVQEAIGWTGFFLYAAALGVPVATSSLLQVPMVQSLLPKGQSVGILTISAETFGQDIRHAAGIPPKVPVRGTGNGSVFTESILTDAPEMDIEAARADNLAAAQALVRDHPEVGAIVLECTNMVPFARDIRIATGRPLVAGHQGLEQGDGNREGAPEADADGSEPPVAAHQGKLPPQGAQTGVEPDHPQHPPEP